MCRKYLRCIKCANAGRVFSDEQRAHLSAIAKAASQKPEWRRQQSEAKKALWANPEWVAKWKASRQGKPIPKGMVAWNRKMREIGIPLSERRAIIEREQAS